MNVAIRPTRADRSLALGQAPARTIGAVEELAARLFAAAPGMPDVPALRHLMVVGVQAHVGASRVAARLAETLGASLGRCLLVRVAAEGGTVPELPGMAPGSGRSGGSEGVTTADLAAGWLLTLAMPGAGHFASISPRLLASFDVVLWDVPALGPDVGANGAAVVAAPLMDRVVLVVETGRTRARDAARAAARLRACGAKLAGVVMNRVT